MTPEPVILSSEVKMEGQLEEEVKGQLPLIQVVTWDGAPMPSTSAE